MVRHLRARGAGPAAAVLVVTLLAAVGLWVLSVAGVIPSATTACAGWTGYAPLPDAVAVTQCYPHHVAAGP